MEELLELRTLLIGGNISDALLLVEEMTEMSKDDKLNKIYSFAKVLLLHLIKQQAEIAPQGHGICRSKMLYEKFSVPINDVRLEEIIVNLQNYETLWKMPMILH